ncbi:MAG: hypothetical protein R3297_11405, partial [Desulfobulbales bacterium]|nr:hypothetical protein [Desulfobulbales bacterium]
MNFSLHYLSLLEMPFSYLGSEKALQKVPEEERLPFHRLLAGFLLWRGKTAEVEELIGANPQSFVASGMAGCLDFMRGNNEQALVNFEKDLHQLKKIGSRRRVFFPDIAGLFFTLALLKTGDIICFGRIRRFINTVRTQQQDNMLLGAYEMLEYFLAVQESGTAEFSLESKLQTSNSITLLFGSLVQYWLSGGLAAPDKGSGGKGVLKLLLERARQNGFAWIAMVLAELIGKNEQDRKLLDLAAEIGSKEKMASIVDTVVLEEPWKRRLQALIKIAGNSESPQPETACNSRIIWLVGYQEGLISISVREQRMTSGNCWSKGRPIALSRLYSGKKLDYMSDSDRRICKTLKREQTNQKVTYRFDLKQTLPAMVGHPMLFLEESPDISVEFVKGEPELLVEKNGDKLHVKLLKDFSYEGVTVIRETPTRFKIIKITEKHKDIARVISSAGLQVPVEHSKKLMGAVGSLSSFMTVHSAIAVDTEAINSLNGKSGMINEVAASRHIYIQLIPLGSGFKLAMFVKPFGTNGPYFKPGRGAENLMAEVDGQRLQTKRDLGLEEEKARAVEEACPTLMALAESDREWLLQET